MTMQHCFSCLLIGFPFCYCPSDAEARADTQAYTVQTDATGT